MVVTWILALRSSVQSEITRIIAAIRAAGSSWSGFVGAFVNGARLVGLAAGGIRNHLAGVRGDLASLGGMVRGVFNLPTLIATGGVGMLAKTILDGAGKYEQTLMGMTTLLKSEAAARAAIDWTGKLADATPFSDADIQNATRRLLGYSFTFEQTQRVLPILADAAAATGQGPDAINRMVLVLGQMRAKGRIQQEDVNQLQDLGLPVMEIFRARFGEGYQKLQEKGLINSFEAIPALLAGLQARTGGASAAQATTIFGLSSTLQSRLYRMWSSLITSPGKGGPLEPFRTFLGNLVNLSDFSKAPGSAVRDRFQASMGNLMSAIFGPLNEQTGGTKAEQLVTRFLDKLDEFSAWWAANGPAIVANIRGFAAGLVDAYNVFRAILAPFVEVVGWFMRLGGAESQGGLGRTIGLVLGLAVAFRVLQVATLGAAGSMALFGAATIRTAWLNLLTSPASWAVATRAFGTAVLRAIRAPFMTIFAVIRGMIAGSLLPGVMLAVRTAVLALVALAAPFAAPFVAAIGIVMGVVAVFKVLYEHVRPVREAVDAIVSGFDQLKNGFGNFAGTRAWFRDNVYSMPGGAAMAERLGLGPDTRNPITGRTDANPQTAGQRAQGQALLRAGASPVLLPDGTVPIIAPGVSAIGRPVQNKALNEAGFLPGVMGVATRLGVKVDDLLAVMNFESRLDPQARNPNSSASGLIQFMASTATGLGTSIEAIRGMSAVEQLPWVEKYLAQAGVKPGTDRAGLYMSILTGHASNGMNAGGVLWREGTEQYRVNAGLDVNRDKIITRSEAAAKVDAAWNGGAVQSGLATQARMAQEAKAVTPPAPTIVINGKPTRQDLAKTTHAIATGQATQLQRVVQQQGAKP